MPKTPGYRKRHDRNQAIVTLTDAATKRRRDYWLGEYGSPESRELYHRVVAEWEANGRRLIDPDFEKPDGSGGSVDAAKRRVLSKAGAFIRTTARTSIRKREGSAPPGKPPHSHEGACGG